MNIIKLVIPAVVLISGIVISITAGLSTSSEKGILLSAMGTGMILTVLGAMWLDYRWKEL